MTCRRFRPNILYYVEVDRGNLLRKNPFGRKYNLKIDETLVVRYSFGFDGYIYTGHLLLVYGPTIKVETRISYRSWSNVLHSYFYGKPIS